MAAALLLGSAPRPAYVVQPNASPATRAAVAAGREPEHGYPAILNVTWTTTHMKPGSVFEAVVTTSPNVVFVGGAYKQWVFAFQRAGTNRFHVAYPVPWLPPFLIGTWPLDVFARTADGVELHRSFEFSYSYF